MAKYLGSGVAKGIGPVYAHRLVEAFGTDVFTVIDTTPERLQEIPGIGPHRAQRILAGWEEQKAIRTIMVFLQSHGVSTAQAVRIYKTYGPEAIATVQANPYQLARDIRGIGFKSADQIASHLGIAPTDPLRVQAGIRYALLEATNAGHCGLPAATLTQQSADLLGVPDILVRDARQELMQGMLYQKLFGFLPFPRHRNPSEVTFANDLRHRSVASSVSGNFCAAHPGRSQALRRAGRERRPLAIVCEPGIRSPDRFC